MYHISFAVLNFFSIFWHIGVRNIWKPWTYWKKQHGKRHIHRLTKDSKITSTFICKEIVEQIKKRVSRSRRNVFSFKLNKEHSILKSLTYRFLRKKVPHVPIDGETEGLMTVAFCQVDCKPNFHCAQILWQTVRFLCRTAVCLSQYLRPMVKIWTSLLELHKPQNDISQTTSFTEHARGVHRQQFTNLTL